MTDLERIEDKYPQLKFWGIEIENPHYHGHIEGDDVYINLLQPDFDWLKTALHECVHYDFDQGDLTDGTSFEVKVAERWAVNESKRAFNQLFGGEQHC